jgi:hypothetical protein
MPIKTLEPVSKPSFEVTAMSQDPETQSKLYTLVESFLLLNPEPSDDQVHMLAQSINMDYEQLEAIVYKFFAQVLEELDDPVTASDSVGEAAENDGEPDTEATDGGDAFKEAAESDGGLDLQQAEETLKKED